MKVKMIGHSPYPLVTLVNAFRTCWHSESKSDSSGWELGERDGELIKKAIEHGHESPLEHVSFTFEFVVSRVTQTQLIRHRIASYSIESMRYVQPDDFHIPESISEDPELATLYLKHCRDSFAMYDRLLKMGVKKEDARYLLPMSTNGKIVMTMNLREIRHFIAERTCRHAQDEIRDLALTIKDHVARTHPLFVYRCEKAYRCPEAKLSACGICLGVRK